jgi:hypothetical protein
MTKADHIVAVVAEKDAEIARLRDGLEQSVALQSHYANILNMADGGKRIVFKTADEWLARLKALKERAKGG